MAGGLEVDRYVIGIRVAGEARAGGRGGGRAGAGGRGPVREGDGPWCGRGGATTRRRPWPRPPRRKEGSHGGIVRPAGNGGPRSGPRGAPPAPRATGGE